MPIIVESVFLERIVVAIHLMVIFTVSIFKRIQTVFAFWGFELWRICFEISFAALSYISIVFEFV